MFVDMVLNERYQLEEQLGFGAQGSVWKAYDLRLERTVAVKTLRSDLANARERFVREARSLAALRAPGVVPVHDHDEHSAPNGATVPYMVMEYVDGPSLRRIMGSGSGMDPAGAFPLLAQVAEALAAAHAAEIVHRDVKPDNVVVTSDLRAVVVDFGIAQGPDQTRYTKDGCQGTPAYAAPECHDDPVAKPATSMDVYSLGVLAHRCLTGSLPVGSGAAGAAENRAALEQAGIESEAAAVILRALQTDPTARGTASDFAAVLREAVGETPATPPAVESPSHGDESSPHRSAQHATPVASMPTPPGPTNPRSHKRPASKRFRLATVAAAAAALMLAAGLVVAFPVPDWMPTAGGGDSGASAEPTTADQAVDDEDSGEASPSESHSQPEPNDPAETESEPETETTQQSQTESDPIPGDFVLRQLQNRATQQCLRVEASGAVDTDDSCDLSDNYQRWRSYDDGLYQNVATGDCLTVHDDSVVTTAECNPNFTRHQWKSWVDATRLRNNLLDECLRGNHHGDVRTDASCPEASDYYVWERHDAE